MVVFCETIIYTASGSVTIKIPHIYLGRFQRTDSNADAQNTWPLGKEFVTVVLDLIQ